MVKVIFFQYAIKKQDEKIQYLFFSKYQKIKWKCSKIMQLKKLVRFPI